MAHSLETEAALEPRLTWVGASHVYLDIISGKEKGLISGGF
jgi:hypothetical protein